MSIRTVRAVAIAAAAITAVLYVLIGFEVLNVGTAKSGTNDILSFGLLMGAVYGVIAVMLALASWRWLLAAIAVLDALVIVGYFAAAGVREPPFELWGLLVKAAQAVLLVALGYLLVRAGSGAPDAAVPTA
jgi:hypothetical protein